MEKRGSGTGLGVMAILVALVFIIGPLAVPGNIIPAFSKTILVGFGVILFLVGAIIMTITRLYRKTSADEAFVRTGMGGTKVIIDGGALVIPVVHNVILVSLKTMKLIVERTGPNALITGDNLRADVVAEFFVRVLKKEEDVLNAATSLGEMATNPKEVEKMVSEKLVSALRTVATTKPLEELNSRRDEFAAAVQTIVEKDLRHNGLTLETPTISRLDQTSIKELHPEDNVFDAQGAKRIAEITQAARVARNQLERDADKLVKEQDVEKDKFIYHQDVAQADARADKEKSVREAEAREELAKVEKDKQIATAEVQKAQAVEVANQQREQASKSAEINKDKTVAVAAQEKDISVLEAQKRKAVTAKEQADAEAEAEIAKQRVQTVTVKATAEREKEKAVITAQAEVEKEKLSKNLVTDVEAYKLERTARARKESADNEAEARKTLALAEKEALTAEADGLQAKEMVPVNVLAKKIDVERSELQNKAEFESISKELQIQLAKIEAEKEVRIAQANAVGVALSKTNMQVWGDPASVTKMTEAFMNGQSYGQFANGLANSVNGEVKDGLAGVASIGATLAKKLLGLDVSEEQVKDLLKNATKNDLAD